MPFPEVKILFMSGYADDAVVRHGPLDGDFAFIDEGTTAGE